MPGRSREFSVTEFAHREEVEVGDLRFVVAKPEDVLIAKLEWAKISPSEAKYRTRPEFSSSTERSSIASTWKNG